MVMYIEYGASQHLEEKSLAELSASDYTYSADIALVMHKKEHFEKVFVEHFYRKLNKEKMNSFVSPFEKIEKN